MQACSVDSRTLSPGGGSACIRKQLLMTVYPRSLVNRFGLSLFILLITAMGALVMIDRWVFKPLLLDGEQRLAIKQLERMERSFDYSGQTLLAHTRDWAHWDDSYQFMQGKHPSYATANFSREMFEDLQYQLMLYIDKARQVVWVAGIDPDTGNYSQCPTTSDDCGWASSILASISDQIVQVGPAGKRLLLTKPWPAIAAISPILRTDGGGPSNGWLVQVRILDDSFTTVLELQTGLPVMVTTGRTASRQPSDQVSVNRSDEHILVSRSQAAFPTGSTVQIGTQLPRELFRSGSQTFQYAMMWTALLLLTVMAVVLGMLAVLVLKPLGLFTRFISEPGRRQTPLQSDSLAKLPAALRMRQDEFGTLARHMQSMLRHQHSQARTLLQLSVQDPLTGLANRRLFDTRLEQALQSAGDAEFSVMMLDIDHFKGYNDHYGHASGDSALVQIAKCMQEHFDDDRCLVARTGGEEFSVLLPNTPLDLACEMASGLRQRIEALALPHEASTTHVVVTMSIGVASTKVSEARSTTTLMRSADRALYKAKAQGRNRVVCDGLSNTDDSP